MRVRGDGTAKQRSYSFLFLFAGARDDEDGDTGCQRYSIRLFGVTRSGFAQRHLFDAACVGPELGNQSLLLLVKDPVGTDIDTDIDDLLNDPGFRRVTAEGGGGFVDSRSLAGLGIGGLTAGDGSGFEGEGHLDGYPVLLRLAQGLEVGGVFVAQGRDGSPHDARRSVVPAMVGWCEVGDAGVLTAGERGDEVQVTAGVRWVAVEPRDRDPLEVPVRRLETEEKAEFGSGGIGSGACDLAIVFEVFGRDWDADGLGVRGYIDRCVGPPFALVVFPLECVQVLGTFFVTPKVVNPGFHPALDEQFVQVEEEYVVLRVRSGVQEVEGCHTDAG